MSSVLPWLQAKGHKFKHHDTVPSLPLHANLLKNCTNFHNNQLPIPATSAHTSSEPSSTLHKDVILPNIDVLRQNPTVAQSVSRVLASYEEEAQQGIHEGKGFPTKCSGRYNSTDTTSAPPELRWANEGYFGSNSRKRTTYDDLTLHEWAVGQLTNVYQMRNPNTAKQARLQVIMALKDATSLPWQAVRAAWAYSKYDVEGVLTWDNSMQWAVN